MKNLKLILSVLIMALLVSACGSGGGSSAPQSPIDTTPHDYVTRLYAPFYDVNGPYFEATVQQICDVGFSDYRNETQYFQFRAPTMIAGMGCSAASNYQVFIENTGSVDFTININLDGVDTGSVTIVPGQTYTYSRGM